MVHMQTTTDEGFSKDAIANAEGFNWTDTETTGLNPEVDQIVQLAVIITDLDLRIRSHWMTYIKLRPGVVISPKAFEAHHLTKEFLERYGAEEEAAAAAFNTILQSFPNLRFAGYNAGFDVSFCSELLTKYGYKPAYLIPWYDTLPHARQKLKRKTENHKLVTVAKHFGFNTENAHDALTDIHATIKSERELRKIA